MQPPASGTLRDEVRARAAAGRRPGRAPGAWLVGAVSIVVLAAVLRGIAIFDDFWIDEIWSLTLARYVHSPLDVLIHPNLRVDNNHPLNTLLLAVLGEGHSAALYRLPALLAGVAAVALATTLGWRRSRREGLLAGGLLAISPLLVAYTSEARGYAFAVLAALAARLLLEHVSEHARAIPIAGFGIVILLGFASHLSFGHAYIGMGVGSACTAWWTEGDWRRAGVGLAKLHALPAVGAGAFLWVFARDLRIGGGPKVQVGPVLGDTLSWLFGIPTALAATALGGAIVLVVLAWEVREQRREGCTAWISDITTILLAPALTLAVLTPPLLFPRYFLISATFLLLMFARAMSRAWSRGGAWRGGAVIVLALVCAGSISHLVPFLRLGRGEYAAAVRYMAAHTPGDSIGVAGDHDFRVGLVVDYHRRVLPPGRALVYTLREERPPEGTEWFVKHGKDGAPAPPARLRVMGHAYILQRRFGYHAPSGFAWWLYRRAGR